MPFIEAGVTTVGARVHASGWTPEDKPLRGILLVVASTVFLASSDAMAKYLALSLPTVEIVWLRYLAFVLIMGPAVLGVTSPRVPFGASRPAAVARPDAGGLGAAFVTALRFLPIAEATTTSFVSPIFVTVLSIAFLGETVGIRRWLATLTGLVGVIIVVRPGTSAFQPAALLAIASALCWACSLVTTRRIGGRDSSITTMAYSAVSGFVLLSAILPFAWVAPTAREIGIGACIGLAATAGHWGGAGLSLRRRLGAVAAELHPGDLGTVFGYAVFADVPDGWTFVGARSSSAADFTPRTANGFAGRA